jgi:hypothetical protein
LRHLTLRFDVAAVIGVNVEVIFDALS